MNNLSGVSLLRALRVSHQSTTKVPFPPAERPGPGEATARSLVRRLSLVLHDLGLDGIVPAGWVSVDGAAVVFGELDVPAADRLDRHLEDIATLVGDTAATEAVVRRRAGAGQGALFGADR
ncbi:MAG TPA: hypothetical protein VFE55_15145 [Acidimicrobiia bacterium]|nr:hypothetical protein [Acidimicrobiia bacterium]